MRLLSVFRKSLLEQRRDLVMLVLTFFFAPFLLMVYAAFFSNTSTTYGVLVINQDEGALLPDGTQSRSGQDLMAQLAKQAYPDGKPLLNVRAVADQASAEALLRNHEGTMFLLIPPDFSRTLSRLRSGDRSVSTGVTFGGDLTTSVYPVCSALTLSAVDAYVQQMTGQEPLIRYTEKALGGSGQLREVDYYVPGVLIFAVILLIFLAAMTVAREVESGTLRRLQITRMSALEYLGGTTLALALIGTINVVITFAVALALGFHSTGPLWVAALVGALTSLSIIGIGMLIACFSKTVSQAFIIANFPLGLLMFFTGAMFPIPAIPVLTVFGHTINMFDFLPPTHAVNALNKILTLGAGLGDIGWELAMLTALSVLYLGVGVWLFRRMHLRPASN